MGLGYAAWHTNITANGGVSASGHWDVAITDARISQLSGATIGSQSTEITGCAFQLSGQTTQEAVAAAVAAQAQGSRRLSLRQRNTGRGILRGGHQHL